MRNKNWFFYPLPCYFTIANSNIRKLEDMFIKLLPPLSLINKNL